jgi:hypothetical protein
VSVAHLSVQGNTISISIIFYEIDITIFTHNYGYCVYSGMQPFCVGVMSSSSGLHSHHIMQCERNRFVDHLHVQFRKLKLL